MPRNPVLYWTSNGWAILAHVGHNYHPHPKKSEGFGVGQSKLGLHKSTNKRGTTLTSRSQYAVRPKSNTAVTRFPPLDTRRFHISANPFYPDHVGCTVYPKGHPSRDHHVLAHIGQTGLLDFSYRNIHHIIGIFGVWGQQG